MLWYEGFVIIENDFASILFVRVMRSERPIRNTLHSHVGRMPGILRFTGEEKTKIGKLARLRGTSASRSIMELVERALEKEKRLFSKNSTGPKRRLSGKELMELPQDVRQRRFAAQAKRAAACYRADAALNFQIDDEMQDYGSSR